MSFEMIVTTNLIDFDYVAWTGDRTTAGVSEPVPATVFRHCALCLQYLSDSSDLWARIKAGPIAAWIGLQDAGMVKTDEKTPPILRYFRRDRKGRICVSFWRTPRRGLNPPLEMLVLK